MVDYNEAKQFAKIVKAQAEEMQRKTRERIKKLEQLRGRK